MYVDPTKFELLLVGPRVAQLKPFFDARGYRVDPVVAGRDGLRSVADRKRDLVILELNLGDMRASEFVAEARQENENLRVILLENADRAGQIVKSLVHGIDAYVPTPPDEAKLFAEVERQLLSVIANSQFGEDGANVQDALKSARAEITQLRMQNDLVRQELESAQAEVETAHQNLEKRANDDEGSADEVAALKVQVEQLQERASEADIVELELRNLGVDDENLLDGIRWVQEQLGQLGEANVAAAMAKATADDLQSELDNAHKEIEALKATETALEEAQSKNLELSDTAAKVAALEGELQEANARADTANQERDERQAAVDATAAEVERLTADIERADKEAQERADQLRTISTAKDSVEGELAALAESLQAKHGDVVARDEALEAKATEAAALEKKIEDLEQALQTADARAMEAAQPQVDAKLATIEEDRKKLADERVEAERLREEAEDRLLLVDVEFDELRAKIEELETKLSESEAEVRDERRKRVEERELGSSVDYAQQVEELLNEMKVVKRERDEALGKG